MTNLFNDFSIFLNGILNAIMQIWTSLSKIEIFQVFFFAIIIGFFVYLISKFLSIVRGGN